MIILQRITVTPNANSKVNILENSIQYLQNDEHV